jgi:putative DNA methylase
MPQDDKRLIEDYLPIEAISAEASREKSVRKGHISTLHLWWARRPLVACRAAVYGALVPATQFVPGNGSDTHKKSLGRANAAKFMQRLCRYPSDAKPEEKADIERAIKEAQGHILKAHAERLTQEAGKKVTVDDILAGRAPRPKVLDMFAGGGAIPLEALRLGCEAYALDLNPVAHIIQLCTLVYPQKYGKPDPNARGMTGPKDAKGETTWGGLAEEVRYWGEWVLPRVKCEIGDLYPPIPDPEFKGKRPEIVFDRATGEWVVKQPKKAGKGVVAPQSAMDFATDPELSLEGEAESESRKAVLPPGYLTPVAYLWTRTVKCKNPACGATVPLVKQTWLCKKQGRFVAMKMIAPRGKKEVRFEVVEATSEKGLGFDPEAFGKRGNVACPFCGTEQWLTAITLRSKAAPEE